MRRVLARGLVLAVTLGTVAVPAHPAAAEVATDVAVLKSVGVQLPVANFWAIELDDSALRDTRTRAPAGSTSRRVWVAALPWSSPIWTAGS